MLSCLQLTYAAAWLLSSTPAALIGNEPRYSVAVEGDENRGYSTVLRGAETADSQSGRIAQGAELHTIVALV